MKTADSKTQLSHGLWAVVPFLSVLLLVFLTLVPMQLPFQIMEPPLPVIGVFYWAVFRPDSVSIGVMFALGVLIDILSGFPIGAHAFLYVLVFSIAHRQQRFLLGQSFVVLWFAFFVVCIIHQVVIWGVATALTQTMIDPFPLMIGALVVGSLFPPVLPFFNMINHAIERAEEKL